MAFLDGFTTEDEFLDEIEKRIGRRLTKRTLRIWRAQGIGPEWIRHGKTILYVKGSEWRHAPDTSIPVGKVRP